MYIMLSVTQACKHFSLNFYIYFSVYKITFTVLNKKLNELKKIFVRTKLKFVLKEFQFVVALKVLRRMSYTVCHAPILMTSYICYQSN